MNNKNVLSPKILIAEDNISFLNCLYNSLINLTNNIETATNGKNALNIIKKFKPSILLLDLKIPGLNGLELLKKISEMNVQVIIISGEINLLNQICIKDYDIISCVFVKPVEITTIYNNVNYLILQQKNINILNKLKELLNEFEFNKSSKGYLYLLESLIEVFNNPENLNNIEKSLYSVVAVKYGVQNAYKVKWCIIKSLKSMCRYTDKSVFLKYYIDISKITPKRFIIEIYDIIKNGEYPV